MGDWDFSNGRLPEIIVAEVAFLVTLTSSDTPVSTIAAKGLREIAIAECLPNPRRPFEESDEAAKRYPLYEQLGDPSVLIVGELCRSWLTLFPDQTCLRSSRSTKADSETATTPHDPVRDLCSRLARMLLQMVRS